MFKTSKTIALTTGIGLVAGTSLMFWSLHRALAHIQSFS
jgi:hypothetical protein